MNKNTINYKIKNNEIIKLISIFTGLGLSIVGVFILIKYIFMFSHLSFIGLFTGIISIKIGNKFVKTGLINSEIY